MRKTCTLLLGMFLLLAFTPVKAQTYGPACTPLPTHFEGLAPAPWAIDGSTGDWESLLGAYTGNPINPYQVTFSTRANQAVDGLCKIDNTDADNPEPTNDIRFLAYTYDDYNIYFYLRRPVNTEDGMKSFFYFLDINADGYLAEGEPVISGSFNGQVVTNLSMGYYVPNTSIDYVAGKGNNLSSPTTRMVDDYTIVGSVKDVFNSRKANNTGMLGTNELFAADVTDDGYGVEFAVPWSFIRNYTQNTDPMNSSSVLLLHAALQTGGGTYDPIRVEDNAGCCFGYAETIGYTMYTVQNKQIEPLVAGTSYLLSFELLNNSNITEHIYLDRFYLMDIQTATGATIDLTQVQVRVYNDLNCNGTIDNGEAPVTYSYREGPLGEHFGANPPISVMIPTGEKACLLAEIIYPEGSSVTAFTAGLATDLFRGTIGTYGCIYTECYDGGRPINPVGYSSIGFVTAAKVPVEQTGEGSIDRVTVYPNPSKGAVNISIPTGTAPVDISIIDFTGKVVRSFRNVSSTQFRLDALRSGMYTIQVKDRQTGRQVVRRLVVQQ